MHSRKKATYSLDFLNMKEMKSKMKTKREEKKIGIEILEIKINRRNERFEQM